MRLSYLLYVYFPALLIHARAVYTLITYNAACDQLYVHRLYYDDIGLV